MGRLRFPLESNDSVNGQGRHFYFAGSLLSPLANFVFSDARIQTRTYCGVQRFVQEGCSFRLSIFGI